MMRLPPRLLALTPGDLAPADVERFLTRASSAIAAGLSGVLLREAALSDRVVLELARALRARLGSAGWLSVHDRVHLAAAAGADAVQLGFRSLAPMDARRLLPDSIAIGYSAHMDDPIEPWRASDFLLLGPVFETPSKAGVKAPLGLEGLARELARAPRPAWALGGITPARARELVELGCAGAAVRSALFGAEDPAAATAAFLDALGA